MTATFHVGDAIEVMGKLPEKSVDLVLTSPPFLALRSYLPADHPDKALEGGSQATPGQYIDWLIGVVEACDRVLAPHGSMCIELGDTYAGSGGAGGDYNVDGLREGQPAFTGSGKLANYNDARGNPDGMRDTTFSGGNTRTGGGRGWPLAKSLSLIPELFRLTLVYGTNPLTGRQTDRWRLRNVVRWVRPNPPVGALGDKFRPATSELMVFCKSAKRYFDLDSVRGEVSEWMEKWSNSPFPKAKSGSRPDGVRPSNFEGSREDKDFVPKGAPPLDWWRIAQPSNLRQPCEHGLYDAHGKIGFQNDAVVVYDRSDCPGGEFLRPDDAPLDWWNIPPGGYEGAHYAVFPPELCIKPIKAMSPERVCRQCGEPSRRIVGEAEYERQGRWAVYDPDGDRQDKWTGDEAKEWGANTSKGVKEFGHITRKISTLGFSDCGHDDWRPGLVLDPFGGSGTTALVATGHGRDCILIDLDERNFDLALQRVGPFILERAR